MSVCVCVRVCMQSLLHTSKHRRSHVHTQIYTQTRSQAVAAEKNPGATNDQRVGHQLFLGSLEPPVTNSEFSGHQCFFVVFPATSSSNSSFEPPFRGNFGRQVRSTEAVQVLLTLVRSCQISEMFRLPKACCNCRGRLSECMPATKRIAVVHQVVSKAVQL